MNQPLPKAKEMKARLLLMKGIDIAKCSSAEFLQLALEAEQTMQDVGPFDAAFPYFADMSRNYLEAAELAEFLEIQEKANVQNKS